jgi:hypothetical protein
MIHLWIVFCQKVSRSYTALASHDSWYAKICKPKLVTPKLKFADDYRNIRLDKCPPKCIGFFR